jgi:NTP pyrophosphatase (non-canonical NTP hydrolase)
LVGATLEDLHRNKKATAQRPLHPIEGIQKGEQSMDPNTYQKLSEVTEFKDFETIRARMWSPESIRLLHAMLGLCTEVGEFADALKKYFIYGKPIDKVNLSEESGDLLWYLALAANVPGMESISTNMERNIAKLKARYGDKFSKHAALVRNLEAERKVLEGNL